MSRAAQTYKGGATGVYVHSVTNSDGTREIGHLRPLQGGCQPDGDLRSGTRFLRLLLTTHGTIAPNLAQHRHRDHRQLRPGRWRGECGWSVSSGGRSRPPRPGCSNHHLSGTTGMAVEPRVRSAPPSTARRWKPMTPQPMQGQRGGRRIRRQLQQRLRGRRLRCAQVVRTSPQVRVLFNENLT